MSLYILLRLRNIHQRPDNKDDVFREDFEKLYNPIDDNFLKLCLRQGFFQQRDYKMFPPWVDWNTIKWETRCPLMDFPVQVNVLNITSNASLIWT